MAGRRRGNRLAPVAAQHYAMTAPNLLGFGHKQNLLGFGHKQDDCLPSCFTQVVGYNYGLGVVRSGWWTPQDPLAGGYSATGAYQPHQKIAIAVVVTFKQDAFKCQGVEKTRVTRSSG
jgi:hypothetical protein